MSAHSRWLAPLVVAAVELVAAPASALPMIRLADAQDVGAVQQSAPCTHAGDFVRREAIGDAYVIAASKLALSRSTDRDVRQLARTMIDNHEAADTRLKATVGAANVDTSLPATDRSHAVMTDDLKATPARDFDRQYVRQLLAASELAQKQADSYAEGGDNVRLKRFAATTAGSLSAEVAAMHRLWLRMSRALASAR